MLIVDSLLFWGFASLADGMARLRPCRRERIHIVFVLLVLRRVVCFAVIAQAPDNHAVAIHILATVRTARLFCRVQAFDAVRHDDLPVS